MAKGGKNREDTTVTTTTTTETANAQGVEGDSLIATGKSTVNITDSGAISGAFASADNTVDNVSNMWGRGLDSVDEVISGLLDFTTNTTDKITALSETKLTGESTTVSLAQQKTLKIIGIATAIGATVYLLARK